MGMTKEQRATRLACVYFIRDPFDGSVRYIGVTTNPRLRRNFHFSSKYTNPKLAAWIRDLKSVGKRPVMDIVLHWLPLVEAESIEFRLIVLHSINGSRLLQMTYRIENGLPVRNLGGNCLYSFVGA